MNIKNEHGSFTLNLVLALTIVAILGAITAPSFKHKNKKDRFREISSIAIPITAAIDKCLGFERDRTLCSSLDKIHNYGYSATSVEISSHVDSVSLVLENNQYKLTLTPSEENLSSPFIKASHTYIKTADIVDRNGRSVIESWATDPKSGCMIAGLCQ